jgi:hypothetical protein
MVDILKDEKLSDEYKLRLIKFANNRFLHRRTLAYMSFGAMVASMVLASSDLEFAKSDILIYLDGFFAMIIATYYGVSSFKPSS